MNSRVNILSGSISRVISWDDTVLEDLICIYSKFFLLFPLKMAYNVAKPVVY